MSKGIPIKLVVSRAIVVEKGDMVSMAVKPFGYVRQEVQEDGIYIGPDCPILTLNEIEGAVRDLRRLRLQRQIEKDNELEEKYAQQFERMNNGYDD